MEFLLQSDELNRRRLILEQLLLLLLRVLAVALIVLLAQAMQQKTRLASEFRNTWAVASAVLVTTVIIDGLFLIAALINPGLSGLI